MKHSHAERAGASQGVSGRDSQRLKNAVARRKLQEMQDEKNAAILAGRGVGAVYLG
jgi:hypothetical protein